MPILQILRTSFSHFINTTQNALVAQHFYPVIAGLFALILKKEYTRAMEKQPSHFREPGQKAEPQDQPMIRRRLGGRSARVQTAVFQTAVQVLQEQGYEFTTIAEIAERAGVHETSIYRRWKTKEALLVEAVLAQTKEQLSIPDTGALRSDLVRFLQELRLFFQSPLGIAITHLLVSTAGNTEVATARRLYWNRRFIVVKKMFERAVQRGEIRASVDLQLLTETVIGPLYVREILTGEPLHQDLPEQIVDLILHGVAEV